LTPEIISIFLKKNQENVVYFGGDPNLITLVGHGTGASLVSLLLTSPVAQAKKGENITFLTSTLKKVFFLNQFHIIIYFFLYYVFTKESRFGALFCFFL